VLDNGRSTAGGWGEKQREKKVSLSERRKVPRVSETLLSVHEKYLVGRKTKLC
jgi:hypothetical protein